MAAKKVTKKVTKKIVPKNRMPRRMQFRIERLSSSKFWFSVFDRRGRFLHGSTPTYARPAKARAAIEAYIEQVGRAVIVEV